MDVVGQGKSNGAAKAGTEAALLEHDHRNDQADQREPGDGRKNEAEDEQRHRQERQHAGRETEERAPIEPRVRRHGNSAHVGRAQDDGAGRRHEQQPVVIGEPSGDRRQDGWADAERERAPEAAAVEVNRLRDELADGSVGRRRAF
jgi:hypothetical protein